jgi:hypothetical protein
MAQSFEQNKDAFLKETTPEAANKSFLRLLKTTAQIWATLDNTFAAQSLKNHSISVPFQLTTHSNLLTDIPTLSTNLTV